MHLAPAFGGDWFGVRAERFARFFGTPTFLIAQSLLVLGWIVLNAAGVVAFDLYPFILLNLAFSLQAAYAAPLILLARGTQPGCPTAWANCSRSTAEVKTSTHCSRLTSFPRNSSTSLTLSI